MYKNKLKRKDIEEILSCCKEKRLLQLEKEFESSREYLELSAQEHRLYNRLKSALPSESERVLLEYDGVRNGIAVLHEDFYYGYGFIDCIFSRQMLYGKAKILKPGIYIL